MISSMHAFSFPSHAQSKSVPKNRIFPRIESLKENRPFNRNHPYGGTLVMGTHTVPEIVNPILTQASISASLMELIFDSLVRINNKGEIVPDLAESWNISQDGKEYTFHLRKGVLFHDGVELTAEDVKFTYEAIHNPENKSPWRTNTELINSFQTIGRYTLKITLREPFTSILYKLTREVVPKHLLEGKDLANAKFFNYAPIGTGPFQFKSWDKKNNQIELVFNPNYFEGRPYLNRVIVKTYSDIFQTWSAFMRHEIDLIQWITGDDYSIIKNDPDFKAYVVSGSMYYAMAYNTNDSIWHSLELRQAIAYGINIQDIMKAFPEMGGRESAGPFHPESRGYNPDVKPLSYDPVKAKMMLMHEGWLDEGQDTRGQENHARWRNKQELELRVLVDERSETYKKMAAIIRQQLAEIGVKVTILLYKDNNQLTKEFLERYKPQAWLRFYVGLGFGEFDSYDASANWYSFSSEFGKLWNYKNEKIDRLYEVVRGIEDVNQRSIIYKEIYKIIYEDQPVCFLFYPSFYSAINRKFLNTDELFSLHMPYWTMKDWYMDAN